jgi:hypothetical protein
MSNLAPTTTIKALHAAIESSLRAHFNASVQQYGTYQPWDTDSDAPDSELRTPALLVELEAMDPDDVALHLPGCVALRCALAVHVVLGVLTDDLQVALRELAAAVITLVRQTDTAAAARPPLNGNHWGLGEAVGTPEAVSARPAEFRPGLNGFDAWIVTWEQIVYLPETLPTD